MYLLMPAQPGIDFVSLAVVFILATLLGFASHAPGSIGVFDAAMLVALPEFGREQLLATLVVFRILYFLIPFAISISIMGMRELWLSVVLPWQERRRLQRGLPGARRRAAGDASKPCRSRSNGLSRRAKGRASAVHLPIRVGFSAIPLLSPPYPYFRPIRSVKRAMVRIRIRSHYRLCAARRRPLGALPTPAGGSANGAPDAAMQISWEVRNRFRLFREERDFLLHTDSARGRSILASEQALELQSDGRGWARNTVNRLCIDLLGRVSEPCTRDNVKESYLTPIEHPVTVRLTGPGSGRRHLRLDARRRRRSRGNPPSIAPSRSISGRAMAGPRSPPWRSPVRTRSAAARHHRDRGARYLHRRPRRQHRLGRRQSGPADRAVGRGLLLPLLSRDREHAILPSEPRRLQGRTGLRSAGHACRCGSARARCGSIRPAIARCTATRPAPRWRSPCNIRTSR